MHDMAQQDSHDLHGMKIAILACEGFEQVEMTEPRKALQQAGAETKLVSAEKGRIQGFNHDKPADRFDVDLSFDEARPEDFDAVLLPGGVMNADQIRTNAKAKAFVQALQRQGKPDHQVVRDANWVSSRKPDDIPAFNQAMLELLGSRQHQETA
jgi:protease I